MSQDFHNPHSRTLGAKEVRQAVDSWLGFIEEIWLRSVNAAATSIRQMIRIAEVEAQQPSNLERLFTSLLAEYANCWSGIMVGVPIAAELAASRMRAPPPTLPSEDAPGMEGAAPRTIGKICKLAGGKPFALPARIIDASQGWAVYPVPAAAATAVLGPATDFVSPFDAGGGRTLFVLSATDYRVADLGNYREIGLAVAVVPASERAGAPGVMFVGLAVSAEFSRDASRAIWGLEKVFHEDLSVWYSASCARFGLDERAMALSVTFPRFGQARSQSIPMLVYSRLAGAETRASAPVVSMMSRSGEREGIQVGGSVGVQLGSANPAGCVCRGFTEQCLCRTVEQFGIQNRLPAVNGWSEHLSFTLEGPQKLRVSR